MQPKQTRYDFLITIEYDDDSKKEEIISGTRMSCYALESTPVLAVFDGADEVYLQHFTEGTKAKRIGKTKKAVSPCES